MPFVMRCWGYLYGGEEGPGEHRHDCYLTKDGRVSQSRAQARVYDSEAEAWGHLMSSGVCSAEGVAEGAAWAEEVAGPAGIEPALPE